MNEKLSLQDIVGLLASKAKMTQKDSDKFYRELFQLILECIYKNDIVKIKDLGTFKLVLISSRESVDVNTGDKINIPAHYRMSFSPDKKLRSIVNKPFAQFESVVLEEGIDLDSQNDPEDDHLENSDDVEIQDNESVDASSLLIKDTNNVSKNEDIESRTKDKEPIFKFLREKAISTVEYKEKISIDDVSKNFIDTPDADKQLVGVSTLDADESKLNVPSDKELEEISRKRIQSVVSDIAAQLRGNEPAKDESLSRAEISNTKLLIPLDDDFKIKQVEPKQILNTRLEKTITDNSDHSRSSSIPSPVLEPLQARESETGDDNAADYSPFELNQNTAFSRIRGKLPLIIALVVVLVFGIYKFAELFKFTPDYEYYLTRKKKLSLTDTLLYLNDVSPVFTNNAKSSVDSNTNNGSIEKNEKSVNQTILTYPIDSSLNNVVLESNNNANLLSLTGSDNSFEKRQYRISDQLNIKIVNKANVFRNNKNKSEKQGGILLETSQD